MQDDENGNWKIEIGGKPPGSKTLRFRSGQVALRYRCAGLTAGGEEFADFVEQELGDGRVAGGAGRGEFAGGGGGNGEMGEGFVALAARRDEERVAADYGVVRGLTGTRLKHTSPEDGLGVFEVTLDEQLRFFGRSG